jgi:hypothetical protein
MWQHGAAQENPVAVGVIQGRVASPRFVIDVDRHNANCATTVQFGFIKASRLSK